MQSSRIKQVYNDIFFGKYIFPKGDSGLELPVLVSTDISWFLHHSLQILQGVNCIHASANSNF